MAVYDPTILTSTSRARFAGSYVYPERPFLHRDPPFPTSYAIVQSIAGRSREFIITPYHFRSLSTTPLLG